MHVPYDLNFKINSPSFNDFLKDEMKFDSEKIKKINHTILSKEFEILRNLLDD